MTSSQLQLIENGLQYNINDAKNTITQMKQYLYCIYELLLRILDNLMKITSDTDMIDDPNNENLENVIVHTKLVVNEINTIVNNAQYNGRNILSDTNKSIVFRLTYNIGHCRISNLNKNDLIINVPNVGLVTLGINGYQ